MAGSGLINGRDRSAVRLDGKSGRSWLHSIALNLVRDNFRAQQRTPTSTSDGALLEKVRDDSDNQEVGVLKKEMGD